MLNAATALKLIVALGLATVFIADIASPADAQVRKQSRECTIEDVAIYEDRVAIQCEAKGGKKTPIKYYAVASDATIAPMIVDLGLSSLRRKVKIFFIDDASLNPPGCDATICRKLEGIVAIER
jgi:hypothetical protein